MLNIYVGEDKIPKGAAVVKDNEAGFIDTVLEDTKTVRRILKNVEHASYCNDASRLSKNPY